MVLNKRVKKVLSIKERKEDKRAWNNACKYALTTSIVFALDDSTGFPRYSRGLRS